MADYNPRWYTRSKRVTHPGTNRARRALTSFMRRSGRTPLTTTPRRMVTFPYTRPCYAKSSYRSVDPQTLHGNVHQVDHVPNGLTNSAAITTMFPLRLCGGKLESDAMVRADYALTTTITKYSSRPLASTPPGMPGTHPPIFWLGDVNRNIPQYYYVLSDIADQYWLPSVRSVSSRCGEGCSRPTPHPIRWFGGKGLGNQYWSAISEST